MFNRIGVFLIIFNFIYQNDVYIVIRLCVVIKKNLHFLNNADFLYCFCEYFSFIQFLPLEFYLYY